jgi:hypothetical protein
MAKVSRYSSYRTMTAYEATKAWKEKRKVMRQEFEARQLEANNAFTNAWTAKIDGLGTIAGQIALDRVIAEGKAKAEKDAALAKFATDVESNKADIKDSIFTDSSSGTLDSGTKIDLDAGTITLSDGTIIDAKTGAKKVNITV